MDTSGQPQGRIQGGEAVGGAWPPHRGLEEGGNPAPVSLPSPFQGRQPRFVVPVACALVGLLLTALGGR